MSSIKVTFGSGKKVQASLRNFIIETDQPERSGGDNSAPSPYELFLASLATCAGFYAKIFCDSRKITTDGIEIEQSLEYDPLKRKLSKILFSVSLPNSFPEQYREPLMRSIEQCAVKLTIQDPPDFEVVTKKPF